jgi:hypothetical protein
MSGHTLAAVDLLDGLGCRDLIGLSGEELGDDDAAFGPFSMEPTSRLSTLAWTGERATAAAMSERSGEVLAVARLVGIVRVFADIDGRSGADTNQTD